MLECFNIFALKFEFCVQTRKIGKFATTDTIRTRWHIKRLIIGMEYILQRVKIYKTVIKFLTQLFLFFSIHLYVTIKAKEFYS